MKGLAFTKMTGSGAFAARDVYKRQVRLRPDAHFPVFYPPRYTGGEAPPASQEGQGGSGKTGIFCCRRYAPELSGGLCGAGLSLSLIHILEGQSTNTSVSTADTAGGAETFEEEPQAAGESRFQNAKRCV